MLAQHAPFLFASKTTELLNWLKASQVCVTFCTILFFTVYRVQPEGDDLHTALQVLGFAAKELTGHEAVSMYVHARASLYLLVFI
jgi:hypothetical protein